MHYVIVPTPVSPHNIAGKPYTETVDGQMKPIGLISLHGFLMRYVINETTVVADAGGQRTVPKMGAGYQGSKNMRKLDKLFEKAKPLDIVAVEDADWDRVRKIIDEMSYNPPHFGIEVEALADAWMKAAESQSDAEATVKQLRGEPKKPEIVEGPSKVAAS